MAEAENSAAKKAKLSPYRSHRKLVEDVCARYIAEKEKWSYRLIRGMDVEKDTEEDDITQEQVDKMRIVITTHNRAKLLEKYSSYASCGQSDEDSGIMMFNTATGNDVIDEMSAKIKTAMNAKGWDKKFDHLFALTAALLRYDNWVHDNEYSGAGGMLI
jgi:hypothetical protein